MSITTHEQIEIEWMAIGNTHFTQFISNDSTWTGFSNRAKSKWLNFAESDEIISSTLRFLGHNKIEWSVKKLIFNPFDPEDLPSMVAASKVIEIIQLDEYLRSNQDRL